MRFSYRQLSRFWNETVEWHKIKAYMEKHLEVEVEDEVYFDVDPRVRFLKLEKRQGEVFAVSNELVIPVPFADSEVGSYLAVDVERKLVPSTEDLGLDELLPNGPILAKDAEGRTLRDYLGLPDILIKLSVLPNRGDLSHVYGLAREIALGMGLSLTEPQPTLRLEPGNGRVSIATQGCLVYVGLLLEDVRVQGSPDWLKLELAKYGQRAINNVVDLTNYFLFTYGQPMHAFDFDKLEGQRIMVRQARTGETMVTLSGEEVHLNDECMVISDERKPVAVAGVIGGKETGTSSDTKNVLLEVAAFVPSYVATSSRRLGIRTDASMLFERGVSPSGQTAMALLFAEMAQSMGMGLPRAMWLAGKEQSTKQIVFDLGRVSRLASVPAQLFYEMAEKRRWVVQGNTIAVPAYRWDINLDDDLADELVKHVGYDAIPSLPLTDYVRFVEAPNLAKERQLRILSSQYFQEVFLVSLLSDRDVELQKLRDLVAVDNPVSMDLAFLRPNLRSTLIKAAVLNQNRYKDSIHIFEVGSVFNKLGSEIREERHIGFLAMGNYWESSFDKEAWTYRHFKGVLQNIFDAYGVELDWENKTLQWAESKFAGVLKLEGQVIGEVGLLSSDLCKAYDLRGPVFVAEIDLGSLPQEVRRQPKWPLRYPYTWRDFSVVIPKSEPVSSLKLLFEGEHLVKEWVVIDLYQGEKIGDEWKSVTVRAWMGHDQRTVTSEEVDAVAQRVLERITGAGWHLRA